MSGLGLSLRAGLGLLFAIALAARVLAAFTLADVHQGVEIWEYGAQGKCAAANAWRLCFYDPAGAPYVSALMPPLTSYVWAALFSFFAADAPYYAYIALNVVVGASSAPLLYWLGRESGFSRIISLLAGLWLALYPTFIAVSASYHATNFTISLTLLFCVLLLKSIRGKTASMALLTGLVGGMAVLTRNELALAAAGAVAVLIFCGRTQLSRTLPSAGALVLGLALATGPWVVRNALEFGRFIPVGAQAGYNLWIGFGPYASGSGNQLDTDPIARAAAQDIRNSVALGDAFGARYEDRLQAAFAQDARAAIAEGGLGRIARLTGEKFTLLVLFDWTDPITRHPLYWMPWAMTHLLALFGIAAIVRQKMPGPNGAALVTIALMLGVYILAYSISGVFARYRMHMEPFIFLFSAAGLTYLATLRVGASEQERPSA